MVVFDILDLADCDYSPTVVIASKVDFNIHGLLIQESLLLFYCVERPKCCSVVYLRYTRNITNHHSKSH